MKRRNPPSWLSSCGSRARPCWGTNDFLYISQQARKKLGLRRGRKERRLPQLLADADLKRFFRAIQDCGDVQHEILLKLLFYTAVRVSELVHIEVGDVDLDVCKIFINRGKGAKDRYILFPASFRLVLKSHLHAAPRNRYLFETRRFGPFTTRRIQQIVQGYREKAGITQPLHPHLFRHQTDGVSEGGQREAVGRDTRECAERLRAGAERWRVRRGAGKDAEHGRSVEAREPANEWRAHGPEDHNHRSERVHPHSLLAQRGEEAGAELQADGEDEQDQAELLHEIKRVMIHRFAEMPDEDAREEHPRRSEADSAELHAPQRHAKHAHEGEHADGVRDGLRLVELEEPAHASGFRRRGLHLGTHAGGVSLEVFVKEAGELFRGGLVGSFVGPRIARDEDLRWHTGTFGSDLETEHRIALGLGFRERAVVDRVDDGACVFETDAFAGAGAAAAPAGIHEPDACVVLAHLLGEQLGRICSDARRETVHRSTARMWSAAR
jgi:Phage integrase family